MLQVIADEIKQRPFNGSVEAYWDRYGEEFGGATPARVGDRSRTFRARVRQRVEQTIDSLPESARQLLSACSVFRHPVPETFWIEMRDGDDPYVAFDLLKGRNLVEYVDVIGQASLVKLHNLIRSVIYGLFKRDLEVWEKAERKAAELWLTAYIPPDDTPNIETVRGYLEAFEHFCEVGDLQAVDNIAWKELDTPIKYCVCHQLGTWGYFQEQVLFFKKYLKLTQVMGDRRREGIALGNLGNAYASLGQYQQAIEFHQQYLTITREIGDRRGKGISLGNLGNAYASLGQYQQAIEFHQQSLAIDREIGDRRGEGISLGNLGFAYYNLDQYQKAIDLYQQRLAIAREIGDRRGESASLNNLAETYNKLDQLEQAIHFNQQALAIKQEIGDRAGEGIALNILGDIQRKLQQYPESLTSTQAALKIFQDIGDRANEAEALFNLANLHHDTNDTTQALHLCQQALAIASDLGIPLKDDCEALLRELSRVE